MSLNPVAGAHVPSPGLLFSSVIPDHPESPGPLKALGAGDQDVKAVMSRLCLGMGSDSRGDEKRVQNTVVAKP